MRIDNLIAKPNTPTGLSIKPNPENIATSLFYPAQIASATSGTFLEWVEFNEHLQILVRGKAETVFLNISRGVTRERIPKKSSWTTTKNTQPFIDVAGGSNVIPVNFSRESHLSASK